MNRILRTVLLGGLVAATAVPVASLAFDGPERAHRGHRGAPMARHLAALADELEITDAQRAEIQAIVQEARAEAQGLRAEMREAMQALDAAITDGADNDTIAGLAIDAHALRAQGREVRKDARARIGEVLTDAQKAELKQIRAERRQQREGRRGEGPGMRGPRGGFDL